jgi:hypothetical protein
MHNSTDTNDARPLDAFFCGIQRQFSKTVELISSMPSERDHHMANKAVLQVWMFPYRNLLHDNTPSFDIGRKTKCESPKNGGCFYSSFQNL